ncbi:MULTISPECIES: gliding motility protein GldN [Myroides]|uniref:Gliding motility protein GldN n=3 Tax=Myroides odoratimimus TaxID=76832 RepID=A0A0U3FC73_9FLAO|nr:MULTISPECIES: gliding motility protein GldN [Myroides]AJA67937.1 gliding motility associated protein GldN [Myroides sp. A21]ALU25214.1 gliding motility protein GldN [Myroides odoratimimus]EHO04858.1 gliding motility associated protein GldN [Myroides odoratimimus CIP 101113]EHO07018.1 gliding motility associated protein GldN [Myroides odoratimimus CCUG 10230]EKB02398.1 gliding motility associated protein GldN [Myroides odoratimimus CCUG 3837]
MNLKNFSLYIVFTLFSIASFAQTNLLNAKSAADIGIMPISEILIKAEGPIPYGHVREKDILFGIKVWENISLAEKANEMYLYPIDEYSSEGRKPLFQVLIDGIKSGEITEVYDNSDFKNQRTLKDIQDSFVRVDTTDAGIEYYNAGEAIPEEYIQKVELRPSDVKEYHIMGMWYFDRNEGQLKYRLLGIAPVVADLYTKGSANENYVELFWIFFADARNTLFQNYAFNAKNPLNPINFDHLLNSRRFSATIYKADNQYGNRKIDDYIKSNDLKRLFEAERIKELIRNLEDDMWNY